MSISRRVMTSILPGILPGSCRCQAQQGFGLLDAGDGAIEVGDQPHRPLHERLLPRQLPPAQVQGVL